MGSGILTDQRPIFFDEKFSSNAAFGVLGAGIADRLQKRHEEGGPLLDLPLSSITGIERQKKLLGKDRILISTAQEQYLFSDGWKDWSPLLREQLASVHGRRIVEETPERWLIQTL